jgi:hypothetical protein
MAKLHNPGSYPAKIVDFGIMKGKNGLPSAAVMFEFALPEGGTDRITWFGSFNGGAREFTIEALIRMGFTGKNGSELNKGNGSGILDQTKEFSIVLKNDTYQEKTRTKVAFVNLPGGSGFSEKMQDGEASVLMGGLNLEADFMQARKHVGKAAPEPAKQQAMSEEDMPW